MGEEGESEDEDSEDGFASQEPPRALERPLAVLLRCNKRAVVEGGMVAIDIWRDEKALGWDQYRERLFSRVFDIPGNHRECLRG
jgi:hypothetical protein